MAKDLNINGNRVINVAEPAENDHVATKKHADYLHALSPDSKMCTSTLDLSTLAETLNTV